MLRYGVTLLAFLAVAGIALHQNGPAPPSVVPEPVELTEKGAVAVSHGERRARPGHRGAGRPGRHAVRRSRGIEGGRAEAHGIAPAVDDKAGDDEAGTPIADD